MPCFVIWYHLAHNDDDDNSFLSLICIAPKGKLFDFPEFLRCAVCLKGFESQLNLGRRGVLVLALKRADVDFEWKQE